MGRTEPSSHPHHPPGQAHLIKHTCCWWCSLYSLNTNANTSVSCWHRHASLKLSWLFLYKMTSISRMLSLSGSIGSRAVPVLVWAVFATTAHNGSRTAKPGRTMVRFTGLFVILCPRASKGKRKIGLSEPLNAQLSTKSSHHIFKSINTAGRQWAPLEKCPLFEHLSEDWGLWNQLWTLMCLCLLALYEFYFILRKIGVFVISETSYCTMFA